MTKKLEKVFEHVVAGNQDKAAELLREHMIEQARAIYSDLLESDSIVEDEMELGDKSEDFADDLDTLEDEVEAEEYFNESDEDGDLDFDADVAELDDEMEATFDLDDEGEGDLEAPEADALDAEVDPAAAAEDAMVNVEDALEELRAAFEANFGDVEDVVADETVADEDMADEMVDEPLEEAASLEKVAVTHSDDSDPSSPVKQNQPDMSDGHAKPVDIAGKVESDSAKKVAVKDLGVDGPQDNAGKLEKAKAAKNAE